MTEATETKSENIITGQCLCGAVTVAISPPRKHLDACHCSMCRRWAGGPHIGLPMVTDPEITGAGHVTRYASSDFAERGFCSQCGTHIFYYLVPTKGYSFPAGLFDDLEGFAMTEEIFVDYKPDYYTFTGERERLTEAEVMAKFAAVMENLDQNAESNG